MTLLGLGSRRDACSLLQSEARRGLTFIEHLLCAPTVISALGLHSNPAGQAGGPDFTSWHPCPEYTAGNNSQIRLSPVQLQTLVLPTPNSWGRHPEVFF